MGRSLAERWERAKPSYTLGLMIADAVGKVLVGLGIGIVIGPLVHERIGMACLGAGVAMVLSVKATIWKPFWS